MPTTSVAYESLEARALKWTLHRLQRRSPALLASVVFIVCGLVYFFWWGLHVNWGSPLHRNWNSPSDLWLTFHTAGAISHGHFDSMYAQDNFATFSAVAFVLAPIATLVSALGDTVNLPPSQEWVHPQAWILLAPYLLLLSTVPLFAFDALAQRLGADQSRRLVLALAQGVALWSVSVFWGHPEDALAVGLMAYAYQFAIDDRWDGAAWIFGIAVAFQPLVVAALPVLLAMAGVKRWARFFSRAVVPWLIVLLGPMIMDFRLTWTALTQQANFPITNHETPWTALAPRLHIGEFAVAGGPGRLISLALACAVGWWSIRWRTRPEMLVWAASFSLALRCFSESVMDTYYLWPALAVAMVSSVRTRPWRFGATLTAATFVTATSQWNLGWAAWWTLNMVGLVVVLICALPLHIIEIRVPGATATRVKARIGQSTDHGGSKRRKRSAKGKRGVRPSRR